MLAVVGLLEFGSCCRNCIDCYLHGMTHHRSCCSGVIGTGLGSVVATLVVDVSPPPQLGSVQPLQQLPQECRGWTGLGLLNGGMGPADVGKLADVADTGVDSEILAVVVELEQLAVELWADGRHLLGIRSCLLCIGL